MSNSLLTRAQRDAIITEYMAHVLQTGGVPMQALTDIMEEAIVAEIIRRLYADGFGLAAEHLERYVSER